MNRNIKLLFLLFIAMISCNSLFGAIDPHIIQTMSLEEKVGQLLIVHFHGDIANDDAKSLIQETKVGGIVYYNWANGLFSARQVQNLSLSLQLLSQSIPLFIAVDQEGGVVTRLNNGFTVFPGNRALGETQDPLLAKMAAKAMGEELRAVGINMNFAPVVDVNSNPRNPIIGVRSFGQDPKAVLSFGENALNGYIEANIIASLKHFPGHGDVDVDSHENLPILDKSLEELTQEELFPFAGLASSADMIMTAHLLVPALDTDYCSTLSEKTLLYLKDLLGFKGVIITDSLVMEGVLKKCGTVDEAAIQALNAGCDILLLGGKQLVQEQIHLELNINDIQRIHSSIVNAVKSGRISENRLNDAVKKILQLKARYLNSENLPPLVDTKAHEKLAQKIASLALKVISNTPDAVFPLSKKTIALFSPEILFDNVVQTSFHTLGKKTDLYFFDTLEPSPAEIQAAKQKAEAADVLFICSYNAWKSASQQVFIQALMDTGKPIVLLVARDPIDALIFPKANLIFIPFSPSVPSIQTIWNYLRGS